MGFPKRGRFMFVGSPNGLAVAGAGAMDTSALSFSPVDEGGRGNGTANDAAAIKKADDRAMQAGGVLVLPFGTWLVDESFTIRSPLYPIGILKPASGRTVTVNRLAVAPGVRQWIDDSAGGSVVFSQHPPQPAWFGRAMQGLTLAGGGVKDDGGWVDAARALSLRASRSSCATRIDAETFAAYRHLGGTFWQEIRLSTGGVAGAPYSWNHTAIKELFSYILNTDAACVYAGVWNPLTSGDPATYVGGRATYTGTIGDTVTITFNGPGDVYVIFIGRTTGNFIKATLDGDTNNCDALPTAPAGYRYFDSYSAVDLTYKRRVKIASNLGAGAHTLILEVMADKNPGSAGDRFYFNALGLSGDNNGLPYQANTRPMPWAAGTAFAQYDQIQVEGRNYYCSVAGITGAVAPTHLAGAAVDGTATWTYMTRSSFETREQRIQAAGSQLEYAYQVAPAVGGNFEDVGGILHGNETLSALSWWADETEVGDLAAASWVIASSLLLRQAIASTHSVAGAVSASTLLHRISADRVAVSHQHVWQQALRIGFFYAAMWPMLHYDGPNARYAIDSMASPATGVIHAADYYGEANPFVGRQADFTAAAWGDVLMPAGAGGVPSADPGTHTALMVIRVHPGSVDYYRRAVNVLNTLAPNLATITPPGFASMPMKIYFERNAQAQPAAVAQNEVWSSVAEYFLFLAPGASVPFPPQ